MSKRIVATLLLATLLLVSTVVASAEAPKVEVDVLQSLEGTNYFRLTWSPFFIEAIMVPQSASYEFIGLNVGFWREIYQPIYFGGVIEFTRYDSEGELQNQLYLGTLSLLAGAKLDWEIFHLKVELLMSTDEWYSLAWQTIPRIGIGFSLPFGETF